MFSYKIHLVYQNQFAPDQVQSKLLCDKFEAPNLFLLNDAIAHPQWDKLFLVVSRMPSSTEKDFYTITVTETSTPNTENYVAV
jgi:hypothetical protein